MSQTGRPPVDGRIGVTQNGHRGQNRVLQFQVQKTNDMATPIFSISGEMQDVWNDIMVQMEAFVNDTNADVDMAYDWVCEMLDIDSFVDNEIAWNSFYNCWESCDNRNDLNTFQIA